MATRQLADLVRAYFAAYESKQRRALEELLSNEFTFTSPRDDGIDKKHYFERCWPFSTNVVAYRIERLFTEGPEAFVQYECIPNNGAPFRNTEHIRIEGDKIAEIKVYFGRMSTNGHADGKRRP